MPFEAVLSTASRLTIGCSGLLIITGVALILLGKRDYHRKAMLGACALAIVFVALYLTRSALYPPPRYAGDHRSFYLAVLWSHTALSLVNFPMAAVTVYLALKERFDRHRRIAPFTAAVWVYVAASGWLVFCLNS